MKLLDLQDAARSTREVANNLGKLSGAIGCFDPDIHFNVLPADYEQLMAENAPTKQWASPSGNTNTTYRFAYYGKGKDKICVSTRFDCLA